MFGTKNVWTMNNSETKIWYRNSSSLGLQDKGPLVARRAYTERVRCEKIRDPGEEAENNALMEAAVRFGYGKRVSANMLTIWFTIN